MDSIKKIFLFVLLFIGISSGLIAQEKSKKEVMEEINKTIWQPFSNAYANLDAKANYVSKMFQCGGYSVNEVRKETRQPLSSEANADKPMIQVNMMPIDKIGMKEKPVIDKSLKEPLKPEKDGSEN